MVNGFWFDWFDVAEGALAGVTETLGVICCFFDDGNDGSGNVFCSLAADNPSTISSNLRLRFSLPPDVGSSTACNAHRRVEQLNFQFSIEMRLCWDLRNCSFSSIWWACRPIFLYQRTMSQHSASWTLKSPVPRTNRLDSSTYRPYSLWANWNDTNDSVTHFLSSHWKPQTTELQTSMTNRLVSMYSMCPVWPEASYTFAVAFGTSIGSTVDVDVPAVVVSSMPNYCYDAIHSIRRRSRPTPFLSVRWMHWLCLWNTKWNKKENVKISDLIWKTA